MDIYDNLKTDVYNHVYTHVDEFYICVCGTKYTTHDRKNPKFCPECGRPIEAELDRIKADVSAARDADRKINNEKDAQFRKDLYEYHGVTDNPKADKAFSIAYEHGHSSGNYSIANYFDDIVDLIK